MRKDSAAIILDRNADGALSANEFVYAVRRILRHDRLEQVANCQGLPQPAEWRSASEIRNGFERLRTAYLSDFPQGIETPTAAQFAALEHYSRNQVTHQRQCNAETSFWERMQASATLAVAHVETAFLHDLNAIRRGQHRASIAQGR